MAGIGSRSSGDEVGSERGIQEAGAAEKVVREVANPCCDCPRRGWPGVRITAHQPLRNSWGVRIAVGMEAGEGGVMIS